MPAANSITYMVDLEQVATTIGAIELAATYADTDRYIARLINAAHSKAARAFDAEAISKAMTTQTLNHMFEWGTAGINNGKTTRRMRPDSPEAKLWHHTITGAGRDKAVGFIFDASKVPVPQPTTTKTGISQEYLSKVKGKHIFWNKAAIMESGTPVKIKPKNGGKLFIPLNGYDSPSLRPIDKARGFIMTRKSVTVVPGGRHAGTFNALWERFWEGTGQVIMQADMEEGLQAHLEQVKLKAEHTSPRMAPASSNQVSKAVAKGRALAVQTMEQESIKSERMSKKP